jgi:hypothetical protein
MWIGCRVPGTQSIGASASATWQIITEHTCNRGDNVRTQEKLRSYGMDGRRVQEVQTRRTLSACSLFLHAWRWPCMPKHVAKDSGNQHTIKQHADGDVTCNSHWSKVLVLLALVSVRATDFISDLSPWGRNVRLFVCGALSDRLPFQSVHL